MPKDGPRTKKPPKKPKPTTNPKTRSKKRITEDMLIGIYQNQTDATRAAMRMGISAEIVANPNRTYSLRRIG